MTGFEGYEVCRMSQDDLYGAPGSAGSRDSVGGALGELRRRYLDAGRSAARYCRSLLHRFPDVGPGLLPELRHFYRLDHPGKLHFIERLA